MPLTSDVMPLDLDIKISDVIAVIALLVAVLSAIYARGQSSAAERANVIAIRESRRPLRLQVFQSMHHFSKYCSSYWTMYHMGEVNRSRELTERINTFKWEIEQQGHLDMSDVEEKAKAFVNAAWKLQRLVDRVAGGQNEPHDREYATAQENVEALVDWFGKENRDLKTLFQPYLAAA
ncbi:MAG: hypothetical protein HYX47_07895 [Burkholderiales bacterium]|nr:hypothetical protein [Burkholderiales bacterium]